MPAGDPTDPAAAVDPVALRRAFAAHDRRWHNYTLVYPVISRRSGGLSIGVNLNPDAACNFDCVYCMVDRCGRPCPPPPRGEGAATSRRERVPCGGDTEGLVDGGEGHPLPSPPPGGEGAGRGVDLAVLRAELAGMLAAVADGSVWRDELFAAVPAKYRRLSDIAFSGDGEPTACPVFADAAQAVIDARAALQWPDVKIVLITNATLLDRPGVERVLATLEAAGGFEVWAKLDAGDEATYRLVNRSAVPLGRVLDNIAACGRRRPVVIQSMFLRAHGVDPTDAQVTAYVDRLVALRDAGARLARVQVYTVARRTAEPWATPLPVETLEAIAGRVRAGVRGVAVEVYG